jgi:hypothetical protein
MIEQHDFKITGQEDISKLKDQWQKLSHIHLDFSNSNIELNKFQELFKQLCQNKYKIFQVDFNNFELNDEKIKIFTNCIKNWDLNHFHINLSNSKINESQWENLFDPIRKMNNLKKLHLVLENVEMNEKKRTYIQNLIKGLPNLISVRLNIKNNKLSKEDIDSFRQLITPFQDNELQSD